MNDNKIKKGKHIGLFVRSLFQFDGWFYLRFHYKEIVEKSVQISLCDMLK